MAASRTRSGRALGVRVQILLGLTLVSVVAVLSTGYLTLWAGGASLRLQRESTATALATAAASSAAALLDRSVPLRAAPNVTRLQSVARDLTAQGELRQVSFLGPQREIVASHPPRAPHDADPPIVQAVLSGIPIVYNYRSTDEGIELLAYAPVRVSERVVGAARVVLSAPPPASVVLARSGWVLPVLAASNVLLVLALGYFVLTRLVVRPLQAVEKATARVTAGDWEQRIVTEGPREVEALAAAFNQMTTSLAAQREQLIRTEKLASVGQLAAGVAHEIGNPLAAILGFVDILRTDAEDAGAGMSVAERRDLLLRVKSETQRIHRIIQDLLAYSRPGREEAQPTDPLKILRASQGLLEPQRRFRAVTVAWDPPEGTEHGPKVMVSPGRLQQVFVNLLINAADAMDGQGSITVACRAESGRARISFSDDGPGVPADLRRKIFDPFFTTKAPGQGTGLGLAISRSIVESYGGALEIGADSGSGATFIVTLPIADPDGSISRRVD